MQPERSEIQRRKLLQFLESKEFAWKDGGHPELAKGAAVWVRKLRKEGELPRSSKNADRAN